MNQETFTRMMTFLIGDKSLEKIGVAVSGGSDSLALFYFLSQWAYEKKIKLVPFILNHHLYDAESEDVKKTTPGLQQRGAHPIILSSHSSFSRIMTRSRETKYQSLALACHKEGIDHLCMGHHEDDQLETVLMRQTLRSHWRGLAGMSAKSFFYGLTFLRPFLKTPKEELISFLLSLNQPCIIDPHNHNSQFLRIKARFYLKTFSHTQRKNWLKTIDRYGTWRQEEARFLSRIKLLSQPRHLVVPWQDSLRNLQPDQAVVLIHGWLHTFGNKMLSEASLHKLWHVLIGSWKKNQSSSILATAGGCLFIKKKETFSIVREWGRIPLSSPSSFPFIWDKNFFCYGPSLCHRKPLPSQGPLEERYEKASYPSSWPSEDIVYRPFSPLYPSFTVLPSL